MGTLGSPLEISGRGLHTGRKVRLRILPDPDGDSPSFLFRRIHRGKILAQASAAPQAWRRQRLCSCLERDDGGLIRTVEHIMACLLISEIDRAIVEMDEDEIPILNGAGTLWLDAIRTCGRQELPHPKRFIRITRTFVLPLKGDTNYTAEPADSYRISIRTSQDTFSDMHWAGEITPNNFVQEIAPCRSYGDVRMALPAILYGFRQKTPLLRGVRPSNVAMLLGKHVLGGMVLPNEFARHRVLDMVGDFALCGHPFLGSFSTAKATHLRNNFFLQQLLGKTNYWEWATFI